jgi:hypothetical protein
MSDQPDATGDPRQAQIRVVVNDDMKHGTYANFLVVTHGPHEFTLDFCQLLPSGEQGVVNADVTARVRVAPTMVGQILRALNTNLSNYEDKFGDVKAIG